MAKRKKNKRKAKRRPAKKAKKKVSVKAPKAKKGPTEGERTKARQKAMIERHIQGIDTQMKMLTEHKKKLQEDLKKLG